MVTWPLSEALEESQSTYVTISKMLMIWVQIFYIYKKKKMKHSDSEIINWEGLQILCFIILRENHFSKKCVKSTIFSQYFYNKFWMINCYWI